MSDADQRDSDRREHRKRELISQEAAEWFALEQRNNAVVVFMGSQPAGLERNAWSSSSRGLGWNRRWKRGLAYRRTEETTLCSTGHIQNGIMFIGRGLAYRKTEETDLLRSKRGSC